MPTCPIEYYISESLPQNLFPERDLVFSQFMHQLIEHLASIDHQHALSRLESAITAAEYQPSLIHHYFTRIDFDEAQTWANEMLFTYICKTLHFSPTLETYFYLRQHLPEIQKHLLDNFATQYISIILAQGGPKNWEKTKDAIYSIFKEQIKKNCPEEPERMNTIFSHWLRVVSTLPPCLLKQEIHDFKWLLTVVNAQKSHAQRAIPSSNKRQRTQ